MILFRYDTVNRNKIHTELQNAGVETEYVGGINTTDIGCEIIFKAGTDMTLVQQIIDAHDPTPLPPKPTADERIKELEEMVLFLMMNGGM